MLLNNPLFSRALLFIVLLIPPLLSTHRYPQTVFFNECAASLALLALGAWVWFQHKKCELKLFGLVSVLLGLLACVLAQWLLGQTAWRSVLAGPICYLALLLMAYICGSFIASASRESVVSVMAISLVVGALLQCLISVAQIGGWDVSGLVMPKLLNSVYGNIAQPNHFGNLLWLGVVSGLYLWLQRHLSTWLALMVAGALCIFSALSASRAVLLYTAAIPMLAVMYWNKTDKVERLRIWGGVAVLALMSVLAQIWVGFGGAGKLLGVASSIGRLNDPGSNGQRLFDWSVAWQTSLQHPIMGSGTGTFAWQTALHSIDLPAATFVRIGENAHNTVLHFAAEMGWVVTGTLLILIGLWLWRRLREQPTIENFWALGILTVIGAHSLVEYPLWYTYFLVPAGFAIGVIDAGDKKLSVITFSRNWLIAPLIAGFVVLAWTYHDYKRLEEGYRIVNGSDPLDAEEVEEIEQLAKGVSSYSMFATHAGILRLRAWQPSLKSAAKEMAGLCDSAVRAKPSYAVLTQCVTVYAIERRQSDSELMINVVCGAFPPAMRQEFPAIVRSAYKGQGWAVPAKVGCI